MPKINNSFYDELSDDWYTATDHPIALLRAENALRNPWIADTIAKHFSCATVLDLGCGGGLLTNYLARLGHKVHGVDLSGTSLAVAKKNDTTQSVIYQAADVCRLPYLEETFDAVIAMDILEHIENPKLLLEQARRVLKPGGLFFFHTFNQNFASWLLIIKAVDWLVPNAPPNMHVYPLFIKPRELKILCSHQNLIWKETRGVRPNFDRFFWKSLKEKKVDPGFNFVFSRSLNTGYCGYAQKLRALPPF